MLGLLSLASTSRLWEARATLGSGRLIEGELSASESGGLRFLPREGFGSGVGRWTVVEGEVFEGALELFLYSAAGAPDSPTELLLLGHCSASGEILCCLFAAEGKREQQGMLIASPLAAPRLFCRELCARSVSAHSQLPPFVWRRHPASKPLQLREFRVGRLDSVFYIPDFISEEEEKAIDEQLAASPDELWRQMAGRRVQECGSRMAPSGAGLLIEELPPWMQSICERLLDYAIFPPTLPPNSVALNEYTPNEGIAPHADGPIYAPRVAILSLFSPAVFRFYGRQPELNNHIKWNPETDTPAHQVRGPPFETLLLQPRSLLLFCGEAFREHCHEVAATEDGIEILGEAAPLVNAPLAGCKSGERIVRSRRVSLTLRHLLEFLLAPEAYSVTKPTR
ncbi:MAG: hypothetical protein SGPRY_000636 [Prymnesium sp.]